MPYTDLAEYLAARQSLPGQKTFINAVNTLFNALEQGDTVADNTFSAAECATLEKYALCAPAEHAVAPVIYRDKRLWLNRIFHTEQALAADIQQRLAMPPYPLPDTDTCTEGLTTEQQQAVLLALQQHLAIINGGPGTGKTYTVARIIEALLQQQPEAVIALAAPTGKAGKRMEESLRRQLSPTLRNRLPEACTLHRLLGISRQRSPLYHRGQPLPADLIIVDEASMLSLELAGALFAAAPADARLILLGDADQLAAVDAGAVLHDLSNHPALQTHRVTLKTTHRFAGESGIGKLATALQTHRLKMLRPYLKHQPDIRWYPDITPEIYTALFAPYLPYLEALQNAADPSTCFTAFDRYRILCAGHFGVLGCTAINQALSALHLNALQQPYGTPAYHGMPLLITANNYTHRLFNGDIGICLQYQGELSVFFPDHDYPVPLPALSPLQRKPAYALTVHKSQGSEYRHVALTIDARNDALLSRELLYTGITRARHQLDIFAAEHTLQTAACTPTRRRTGLHELLAYPRRAK